MKNLTVATKLVILIVIMGLMGLSVGIFGIYKISESNKNLHNTLSNALLPYQELKQISAEYSDHITESILMLIQGKVTSQNGVSQIENALERSENLWKKYQDLPKETEEYRLAANTDHLISEFNNYIKNLIPSLINNKQSIPSISRADLNAKLGPIQNKINQLSEYQVLKANNIQKNNDYSFFWAKINFAIILFFGVLISMIFAIFIMRGIHNALARSNKLITELAHSEIKDESEIVGAKDFGLLLANIKNLRNKLFKANRAIDKLAQGDLQVELEASGEDEIGKLLGSIKQLIQNLSNIITSIHKASDQIASTSLELSSNSQQTSQGATEQASSVEEMAASMEEISVNILQNAKNAEQTEEISSLASEEFEKGRGNIDITVEAIKTIASKISIIDEIAFQTNILALNAAVEAARAGEHGRGFGVVASEVGKLAERSKIAAAEIDELSRSGVELSLKSRELLQAALPNVDKTLQLVKEIHIASAEQSTGVEQINMGIQTLNQVTQQNAASSEEMATVSEQLAAQAEHLKQIMSFFDFDQASKVSTLQKTQHFLSDHSKKKQEKYSNGMKLNLDTNDEIDAGFETF